MTGRTHDLAAFTLVSAVFVFSPLREMSLGTLIVSLGSAFLGGLYPDLDNASSDIWDKIPGGSLFGKMLAPLMGGHRMITHSLLGVVITGVLLQKLLTTISGVLIVDMEIVWWTFMIGYFSHLITDAVTREGVPLLFPLPMQFGIPPISKWRIKSGGFLEKSIVYPGLLLLTGALYYQNYDRVLDFFRNYLK